MSFRWRVIYSSKCIFICG